MLQKLTVRKEYDTRSAAQRVASMLNADDDDGWSYKVLETRDAEFVIAIYNDDDDFLGYWGD